MAHRLHGPPARTPGAAGVGIVREEEKGRSRMQHEHKKLWWLFGAALLLAFTLLGVFGREVYRQKPPIPDARRHRRRPRADDRATSILTGQQVWQSTGGQQLGSVWGHGAYQAPDWSADWLHREATRAAGRLGRAAGRRVVRGAAGRRPDASCTAQLPGRAAHQHLRRRRTGTLTVERRPRRGHAPHRRPLRRASSAATRSSRSCARTTRCRT